MKGRARCQLLAPMCQHLLQSNIMSLEDPTYNDDDLEIVISKCLVFLTDAAQVTCWLISSVVSASAIRVFGYPLVVSAKFVATMLFCLRLCFSERPQNIIRQQSCISDKGSLCRSANFCSNQAAYSTVSSIITSCVFEEQTGSIKHRQQHHTPRQRTTDHKGSIQTETSAQGAAASYTQAAYSTGSIQHRQQHSQQHLRW